MHVLSAAGTAPGYGSISWKLGQANYMGYKSYSGGLDAKMFPNGYGSLIELYGPISGKRAVRACVLAIACDVCECVSVRV
jgi:hypothetical protein